MRARVHLKQFSFHNINKVAAIKAVRILTGMGLKESKDLVNRAMSEKQFGIAKMFIGVLEQMS